MFRSCLGVKMTHSFHCVILGFHVTSQYFPNMDVRHICAPRSVKLYGNVSLFWVVLAFFELFCGCSMDLSPKIEEEEIKKFSSKIPVLSEYATALESHVKLRYLKKISVVGIDPFIIPYEEFNPECLPPIEQSDLFGYLVLQTSYYTNDQFKNYRSLEAYNQVVSGFVASVGGKIISGKYVVAAKVRHSQRMNDPLVNVWIITESEGAIISAHCSGCKAGLGESCSHVASAMMYIECWARINGKMACTEVKCSWLLPTYVNEVTYERVRDIDFTSAKKLKENLDIKIDSLDQNKAASRESQPNCHAQTAIPSQLASTEEMNKFLAALNLCEIKPVVLSVMDPYAEQFVVKSRNVPVLSDLYDLNNLELDYPELLQKCVGVKIMLSDEDIKVVEQDTREQAKGPGFFRHRAGRIGASVSGAVYHSNIAQPSQSLIKSVCYPHLYKVNSKAIRHGCKYEEYAIKAYKTHMEKRHVNFQVLRCGLFINKQYPFLHATPDFLTSCDCCGLGCGEVKCPICIQDGDFDKYVQEKSSCLEKVDGTFMLKRKHNYYFQVQQQLFTLPERKFNDFVVCAIDSDKNAHLVIERIYPDPEHSNTVLPKLEAFWRICILPEILGRWFTRRCDVLTSVPNDNGICFCRGQNSENVVSCSNVECPYGKFHIACLSLSEVPTLKLWYCPHCCRLPQFKQSRRSMKGKQPSAVNQAAMMCSSICICNTKATPTDRLLECHGTACKKGKFFHLSCLGFKRMPNNSKTTWQCEYCRPKPNSNSKFFELTTSTSSATHASPVTPIATAVTVASDSNSDSEDEISITKETRGTVDKFRALANLDDSDYDIINDSSGWLTCDIVQAVQVLLQELNPLLEGLQRPTLGPIRNFDVVSGEFIQILHTGSDHWVCVSSIGCLPGKVHLYDSLFHDVISQEIEDQTNDLLGGNLIELQFVPVQQQTNNSDCGVFASAFAVSLALGTNPKHVTFDTSKMRPHLAVCLKAQKLSMFPVF
ncbi:uncharacterized protein [Montipora foliosa]|uniref:uncharacterized protein n=2 Tax=Montipora TaxID=46703 RepID=UPI0035F15C14